MPKKASVPLRIAPLQCVIAEPITDPAEQAALDKLRKREKRKKGGRKQSRTARVQERHRTLLQKQERKEEFHEQDRDHPRHP